MRMSLGRNTGYEIEATMRAFLLSGIVGLIPAVVGAQAVMLPTPEPFGTQVRTTIRVDGEPDWLEPQDDAVWALTNEGMVLVDPRHGGTVRRVAARKLCGAPISGYGRRRPIWMRSWPLGRGSRGGARRGSPLIMTKSCRGTDPHCT